MHVSCYTTPFQYILLIDLELNDARVWSKFPACTLIDISVLVELIAAHISTYFAVHTIFLDKYNSTTGPIAMS
jgi:hypothetical protein